MTNGRSPHIHKKIITTRGVCEMCGSEVGLEVHHKVPIILGGSNSESNLMVLCSDCHQSAHKLNRSQLTKEGIKKSRDKEVNEVLIDKIWLLQQIQEQELTNVLDIIDLISEAPIRKTIKG